MGLGIAAIFAVRFIWMHRLNGGPSRLPKAAPAWEHRASRLAHFSLYLCVLAIVATGLLIMAAQNWRGGQWDDAASDVHEFVANLTLFVIGAHIAAALWHKLMRRDGVWESMGTPWWQPKAGWLRRAE